MTTSPERVSEPATRILIVEDEDSLADSVRYNLEREGYEVTVATDGRDPRLPDSARSARRS